MRISLILPPTLRNLLKEFPLKEQQLSIQKPHPMAKKNNIDEDLLVDVQEVYTKTERFIDANQKPLTYGIGGVVVIVLGVLAYQSFVVKPAIEEAETEAWRAESYFASDSMNLAAYGDGIAMGLDGIAEKFGSMAAGERAHYELGIYHRDMAEYDTAIEHFESAVGLGDGVVSVLAQGGIGDCWVELGDYAAAAKAFDKAASAAESSDAADALAPMFCYKAALAHLEQGNTRAAADHLATIVNDYPTSQAFSMAQVLQASIAG